MRVLCLPRALYFLLLFSLLFRIPAATCYLPEYVDCHSPLLFQCGEKQFNVSYPFMADRRKDYCGLGQHYNLSCEEGIPVIKISGRSYRVKRIDYEAGVLAIADLELEKEGCPLPYDNASLDWSLFEYTIDDRNLTLHYNCTSAPVSIPVLHEIRCLALPGRPSYFTLEDPPDPLVIDMLGSCFSATVVPLGPAAVESLNITGLASIRKAVAEGFDVRWTAGNSWCGDCRISGGACGYNYDKPEAPQVCFCPDSTSPSSCPVTKGGALSDDPRPGDCEPRHCGDGLNISYPFLINDLQPPYCGYPGFEITCHHGAAVVDAGQDYYFVEKIFYGNKSVIISSAEFRRSPCPYPRQNLSLPRAPFNISSVNRELVFYLNCSQRLPGDKEIECADNGDGRMSVVTDFPAQPCENSSSCASPCLSCPSCDPVVVAVAITVIS